MVNFRDKYSLIIRKAAKQYILIISLLFLLAGLNAQTSGPNTVLWKISGDKNQEASYLFGTIHIMPKLQFQPYDAADERLLQTDQLILEMVIDVPLQVQMEWAAKMMLPEGQTISDFMEEDDYLRVKSYALDTLNVKSFLFNTYVKMKPFAFYSALIPHIIGKKIEGYDMHFSKIAKKEEIPVLGLETFDYQMGIFDSISYKKQMKMFFTENMDLESELDELIEMYLSHDIYKMAEVLSEETDDFAEFENELLIRRNAAWADKLSEVINERPSFIAVGAAHLAGEYGLIKQLREKGFKVEPVMLNQD